MIEVGLVGESQDNIDALIVYSRRISSSVNAEINFKDRNIINFHHEITEKDLKKIKRHFDTSENKPEFIVICTDRDGNKQKRNKLQSSANKLFSIGVVLAIPKEEFENWTNDQRTLGNVIGYKQIVAIKKDQGAKTYVNEVIGQSGTTLSTPTIAKKVAELQPLDTIRNGFQEFMTDFKNAIQNIEYNKEEKRQNQALPKRVRKQLAKIHREKRWLFIKPRRK